MAVFVAASDESTDGTVTGSFMMGGWLAREPLWYRSFAPMWQRRVLDGPPKIDYLHMVDIKSPEWRAKHGITFVDAERRLDEAFDIIDGAKALLPIAYHLDAGHLQTEFSAVPLHITTPGGVARKAFQPDYLCFTHYAIQVLNYVHHLYKDANKVDFIVEKNGRITDHIKIFYEALDRSLKSLGADHLAGLMGDFIPGDKTRVPLQAADVLLWHTQAHDAGTLSESDHRRYGIIATRKGYLQEYTKQDITDFAQRAHTALYSVSRQW